MVPAASLDADPPAAWPGEGGRHHPHTRMLEHTMSELTKAMIVNVVVLAAVLITDLGPARAIGRWRLVQPLIVAAALVPLFLVRPATGGTGLMVEIAGVVAGLLGGLAAVALIRVSRGDRAGQPVSSAGAGYAIFWVVVIAARSAFSYGSVHWFPGALTAWAIANQVSPAAITDGLIFMAVVMLLVRTAGLWLRASRLPEAAMVSQQG